MAPPVRRAGALVAGGARHVRRRRSRHGQADCRRGRLRRCSAARSSSSPGCSSRRAGRPPSAAGSTRSRPLPRAALFWSQFEQAGSTLNLFADRATRTEIARLEVPEQLVTSRCSRCSSSPSRRCSRGCGCALGRARAVEPDEVRARPAVASGAGFARARPAAATSPRNGVQGQPVWLVVTYLLHTFGELSLSPVGLSAMTKLAPARIGGLMMGVWFLAISVGNFTRRPASRRSTASMPLPTLFGVVGGFGIVAGVVMFAARRRPIKRLMGERERESHGARRIQTQSATSRRRPSPKATVAARSAPSGSSACRSTSPATCTTTSVSSTTACCCRGRCRKAPRSIRRRSAWRCRSRIIRSPTASSKASSPKATAPASSCSGTAARGRRRVDDVDAALKKGDLKFTLNGYKLKGSWVLVRTGGRYAGRARRRRPQRGC